ncbi:hypothetical protein PQO03_19865 [Lentisphaera profundi]|uniref:Yip1 domain-containing protein n=1 Tax=Lentisphaera profundi TaxID=1658616 RepID=A0ABY7VXS4_9BACT|nr:hypothetical protein [Lentisphaera profundi]WDE98078.1 hypothetical protein PQO03_19865 [Lentisphaera profundi]
MEHSSSGRLKKMGFNPDAPKAPESKTEEESSNGAEEAHEDISETNKLRLARKPTQVDIDLENTDALECPSCGKTMELGIIICLECEMNIKTGKKLKTKIKTSRKGRNAYAAPDSTNDLANVEDFGGFGRGKYWLLAFITGLIGQGITLAITGFDAIGKANAYEGLSTPKTIGLVLITLISFIIAAILQVGRLRNLNMSGWRYLHQFLIFFGLLGYLAHWSIGTLITLAALFYFIRYYYWILICPSGYEGHRKLDKSGKVLLSGLIVILLLTIAASAFAVFAIINETTSSGSM